jgi:hypothetical protein
MNGPGALEDGYRRLLALYPAEHRRAHEEEMLGVLMTGASAGQRRPGLAESASLIWGALRIRFRPGRDASADRRWRDALAVVSVVLPLLFLLYFAVLDPVSLAQPFPNDELSAAFLRSDIATLGQWLILTALVLLRLRRIAALAAAGMLIWFAVPAADALNWSYIAPWSMLIFLALGMEIAALMASPGPRRGLQILTPKHYALAVVVAATTGSAINWQLGWPAVSTVIVITVIAASMAGMAAASPLSRRIMFLLSFPAYYYIVHLVVMPSLVSSHGGTVFESGWVGPLRFTVTCLPLAMIACLAIAAVLRAGHYTNPAGGQAA